MSGKRHFIELVSIRRMYVFDLALKLFLVFSESRILLVQTEVCQMCIDVPNSLWVDLIWHRTKPHETISVDVHS